MAETIKIEQRTEDFIKEHARLKKAEQMPGHEELAKIIGAGGKTTISNILGKRQNIQPEQWKKFKDHFGINNSEVSTDSSVPRATNSENGQNGLDNQKIILDVDVLLHIVKESNNQTLEALKDHNQFLQRLVEANLKELSVQQRTLSAQIMSVHDYTVEKESTDKNGNVDQKKANTRMLHIYKLIDERLPADLKGDIPSGKSS